MPNGIGRKTVIVEKDGEAFEGTVQCDPVNGIPIYVVYVHSLVGEQMEFNQETYDLIMDKAKEATK